MWFVVTVLSLNIHLFNYFTLTVYNVVVFVRQKDNSWQIPAPEFGMQTEHQTFGYFNI